LNEDFKYFIDEKANKLWEDGIVCANYQNHVRDLANTPANLLTPSIFASRILDLCKGVEGVQCFVHDKSWAEEKKMGLFLGVSNGSEEPPRFVELHYKAAKNPETPPIVLVGKGITFDSGGISIKPAAHMTAMKADMMGAAVVLNTLIAAAQLKLPINLVALAPMCENLPSGKATKPGDVHTASNGTTVEVDNTDAEGRLILGDALIYAESLKPHTIVDVATLTGAIGMALGDVFAGAFTKDDKLWEEIKRAGEEAGEPFWRMPLTSAYGSGLKSDVADLVNIAGPGAKGGASIAAAFLSHFVTKTHRWVHLDIAGVMEASSASGYTTKGMTGKSMRTLVQFLANFSQSN